MVHQANIISYPGASTIQFPFLRLPLEIRNIVYRFLVVAPFDGRVYCRFDDIYRHLFLDHHLSIVKTNIQVRQEGQEVFYTENVFIFDAHHMWLPCIGATLNGKRVGMTIIDIARVRNLHLLAPTVHPTGLSYQRLEPEALADSYQDIFYLILILTTKLPQDHRLTRLLIEAMAFEFDDLTCSSARPNNYKICNRVRLLEALRGIRNVQTIHIQAFQKSQWKPLREAEQIIMTSTSSDPSPSTDNDITSNEGIASSLYQFFRTRPLYAGEDIYFRQDSHAALLSPGDMAYLARPLQHVLKIARCNKDCVSKSYRMALFADNQGRTSSFFFLHNNMRN